MKKITALIAVLVTAIAAIAYNADILRFNGADYPEDMSSYPLEVHYIDVGQADAALIKCDGEAMLIDGGNVDDSRLISSYLKGENVDKLKYVVCTHAHEDHVGGLSGALATVSADRVFAPKTDADTKAYKNFKKKVNEQGLSIETPSVGDIITLGAGTIEFLGPVTEKNVDLNCTSIVLKMNYKNTSFLFTGDAERDEEEDILSLGADLKSTVLKTGHHGSSTSTTYPFLRAVMPRYAVISCEKGNSYGHPHKETLSKLNDAGVEIYRTDKSGTIIMLSDGERVVPITER